MDIQGKWNGIMHDAEGQKAQFDLDLEQRGSELRGEFCITPITTHVEKSRKGEVSGSVEGERVTLKVFNTEMDATILFEGRSETVKTHAKAAIKGIYDVEARSAEWVGGVAIFWQYVDKQER